MSTLRNFLKHLVPESAIPALGAIRRILAGQRAVFPADTPIINYGDDNPDINGETFLIRAYAPGWKICFDIGANRGYYADAIRRVNPDCTVTSFEPTHSLVERMKARSQPYGDKWIIQEAAVGETVGTVTFNVNAKNDDHSSLHLINSSTTPVQILQTTLDAYCLERDIEFVDFVKIDTEGNDVNVVKGATKMIAEQRIGMMQIEYSDRYKPAGTSLRELYELLTPTYAMFHLEPTGMLPTAYNDSLEFYWYSNWVAISYEYLKKINVVNTTPIIV